MNSDSLNMVSRLGEGHTWGTFFLSEPQLKTTVVYEGKMDTFFCKYVIVYRLDILWC